MCNLDEIIAVRRHLHQHPELSNREYATAEYIIRFLEQYHPYKLYTGIGGTGIIAHFKGDKPGISCMFRCEMDALPITEENSLPYKSVHNGIAHLCGHDGHAAILCGVAQQAHTLDSGDLYLLFQPAEEIGEGAARMQEEIEKRGLHFDYAYALHNLPGKEENTILLPPDIYAYASVGMEIKLQGHTAHAAEPHLALNPSAAIIDFCGALKKYDTASTLCTVVHLTIGEPNYGITPGNGEIRLTIRATTDSRLAEMQQEIEKTLQEICTGYGPFKISIHYHDPFPATVNNPAANKIIETCALKMGYKIESAQPQKGSDDFAFFTVHSKASFFDIGCGIHHPALHCPDYDFNENLIEPAIRFICCVYQQTQLTGQAGG